MGLQLVSLKRPTRNDPEGKEFDAVGPGVFFRYPSRCNSGMSAQLATCGGVGPQNPHVAIPTSSSSRAVWKRNGGGVLAKARPHNIPFEEVAGFLPTGS